MKVNLYYHNIEEGYLFTNINKKVTDYKKVYPDKNIISLGIGDVTKPLTKEVVKAMNKAILEMGTKEGFKGYGPEQGYSFLKKKIQAYYQKNNVFLDAKEIFISDGAKSDLGNILDLFAKDNIVLIPNPVYPVYRDTNIMAGRKIVYLDANEENHFLPMPDENIDCDIIYLCSPNNPTGSVYDYEQLTQWVNYANKKQAVILFDAAYEAFITGKYPRSIYEIKDAKYCAIEFCSFSKTAGFTGVRCGYTIVPETLEREEMSLNKMWLRRQTTKFNGVSYIVQRGAEAVFSEIGYQEIMSNIEYYQTNSQIMMNTLDELGIWYCGGKNSPYIWLKVPQPFSSWEFFDYLLDNANIVGTPGIGFGSNGEGYFRLTSFNTWENTQLAMKRFKEAVKKII